MPIIEIDKSVLEEIEDVIAQRDKMYENQIATTKKLTDGIEKLYEQEVKKLRNQLQQKENIIKEVREYITSYESIETIQQFDHNKNNKDLDYSTMDEMTRRYMMVHNRILEILDKVN